MRLRTAAYKPWKLLKYALVASALNSLAYSALGLNSQDETRERKEGLPEEKSGRLLGGIPRMIRMPWNSDKGLPVFLDVRRWVPGGDIYDADGTHSAIPIVNWLSVGGPLEMAMEFMSNKTAFTGKPIVKDTDTTGEKTAEIMSWAYRNIAPNMPLPNPATNPATGRVPGFDTGQLQTPAFASIQKAEREANSTLPKDQSPAQAVASAFGVKLSTADPQLEKEREVAQFEQQQGEILGNLKSAARAQAAQGIQPDEFADIRDRNTAKLQQRADQAKARFAP